MARKHRNTKKTKSLPIMSDESDFSFDEAFRFSEAQFLNEDSSDHEDSSINALLAQRIDASLVEDLLGLSDDSFFDSDDIDSDDDDEEEELWEKIRELSLYDSTTTLRNNSESSVAKDTSSSQMSKKKSEKKPFGQNNRLKGISEGNTATNLKKNGTKKNPKPPRKSKIELEDELNSYQPMNPMSAQGEKQLNRSAKKTRDKKSRISEVTKASQNLVFWREHDSVVVSDSDDNVIDLSSDEEDSDSISSSTPQRKNTKKTTTEVSTPKSKSQIRKERREEKKEKRKEKRERIKKLHNESVNIHNINRLMRDFVKEPRLASIPLQCMDRGKRRAVHLLAKEYNLVSKSKGAGDRKYPVLYRTQRTSIPVNSDGIHQILQGSHSIPRKTKSPYDLIKSEKRNKQKPKDKSATPSKVSRVYNPNSPVPPVGSIVGQHAKPIGETNIGHQMLQKLGWSPGQSLASSSSPGRTTPVEAIVRGKSRIGLGGAL